MTLPRENPPPESNTFFKIETKKLTESVDGLNSSVAIVAGELERLKRFKPAPKF